MVNKFIKIWQVGKLGFGDALKLQSHLANLHHKTSNEICDVLLLVEHPPVYTIGLRTKQYSNEDVDRLKETGAEFYSTNRGGLITFHGPGQLVAYPIINLKNFKPSMRWYVCQLEKTIIQLCKQFNINATTSPHTGVWVGNSKICAIGVHGSRFVTTHGLALNCNIDLSWYNHIVPCGITDKGVTSLSKESNLPIDIDHVCPLFIDSFCETFECSYVDLPNSERETILKHISR